MELCILQYRYYQYLHSIRLQELREAIFEKSGSDKTEDRFGDELLQELIDERTEKTKVENVNSHNKHLSSETIEYLKQECRQKHKKMVNGFIIVFSIIAVLVGLPILVGAGEVLYGMGVPPVLCINSALTTTEPDLKDILSDKVASAS